jgi:hypothetical protein
MLKIGWLASGDHGIDEIHEIGRRWLGPRNDTEGHGNGEGMMGGLRAGFTTKDTEGTKGEGDDSKQERSMK